MDYPNGIEHHEIIFANGWRVGRTVAPRSICQYRIISDVPEDIVEYGVQYIQN